MISDAEYILPLKWSNDAGLEELCVYLRDICAVIPVLVVDGSAPELFSAHARSFPPGVRQLRPRPRGGSNGKVEGVLTGLELAGADKVIIADDDVRYTPEGLRRCVLLLESAAVVRPQNYFDPLPWHAKWDTGRTLLNRALGADYPGTLAVRRSVLLGAGGYSADVLFENLELLRTVRAAGGTEMRAEDLYVARRPCSTRHFFGQRVRQAYDDFAQPARLAVELALLPLLVAAFRRPALLLAGTGAVVALAARGRRKAGGAAVFARTAPLWAPLWMAERAVCVWLALWWRLRGGVPYAGKRVRTAGHSVRALRRAPGNRNGAGPSPGGRKETCDPETENRRQLSQLPA